MNMEIAWTIIVLGALLHSTQSDPANPPAQSDPTDPAPQSDPTDPAPQSDPTDPAPQSDPTDPAPQSDPTDPAPQSDPTDPPPQSDPTDPPSQSNPVDPPSQSNPVDPPSQSNPVDPPDPTNPPPQSDPVDPPSQSNPADPPDPTNPPPQSDPVDPPSQSNPVDPPSQSNPADPPDPTNPPPQSNPADPPSQSNPVDPPSQSNPADPPSQSNPADPPPQSNPTDPPSQSDPDDPHRQTDTTDLDKQRDIVNHSNAESVDRAAPDSVFTVTPSQQTLEAQTSTIPMTSAPHQTNDNFISTAKTEDKTKKTFARDFDLSENSKEDVLLETCKTLGQKMNGKCSVSVEIQDKQLLATIKIAADQYIPEEHYKASPNTEQEEDAIKETIPDTLIAILASCGALVLILCIFAAYCTYHRRSYRKNQQHLTEELQTVENGYHDNPTLEVMEVQPEMQEKKVALNRDFNDSWIVPIDNLLKEDMADEEDTHL